jgi:hypothetical protein
MIETIVKATNEKIEETLIAKEYTRETLQKSPHIDYIDQVNTPITILALGYKDFYIIGEIRHALYVFFIVIRFLRLFYKRHFLYFEAVM